MDPTILAKAAEQGIWAALFVALLFYVLRVSERREEKLMGCLEKFSEKYEGITESLCEVKQEVQKIGKDVAEYKEDLRELKQRFEINWVLMRYQRPLQPAVLKGRLNINAGGNPCRDKPVRQSIKNHIKE